MEIPGKPPLFAPKPNTPGKEDPQGGVSPDPDRSRVENDTVDLSENAYEIREMVHKVNNLPDVREAKVAELKRRIASGSYRVMNDSVASRLIGETVENNTIFNQMDEVDD